MNEELSISWKKVEDMVEHRFGEKLDEQSILFVIGLQELGKNDQDYKRRRS